MAASSKRTLVLLRHAKSAWPDLPDHERPLAPRGRRDAPVMGRWLRRAAYVPDTVLCSTARRARQTWQLAEGALQDRPAVTFEHGIYGASAAGLLDVIRHAPSGARTVVVVGHDPAVQDLALALAETAPDADRGTTAGAQSPDALNRVRTKFHRCDRCPRVQRTVVTARNRAGTPGKLRDSARTRQSETVRHLVARRR